MSHTCTSCQQRFTAWGDLSYTDHAKKFYIYLRPCKPYTADPKVEQLLVKMKYLVPSFHIHVVDTIDELKQLIQHYDALPKKG